MTTNTNPPSPDVDLNSDPGYLNKQPDALIASPDVDFETALEEKIKAACDTSFHCGEWNSDDIDSYDKLLDASDTANDALKEFVTTALTRARAEERERIKKEIKSRYRSLNEPGCLVFNNTWNAALGRLFDWLELKPVSPPETTTDER